MENISNVRPLQVCLILTLISICAAWPFPHSENVVFPSDTETNHLGVRNLITEPENCTWPQIWYPQSSRCEELLTRGPCGNRQWLVLGLSQTLQCQAMQCMDTEISYKGTCVALKSTTRCPKGMEIVATVMGIGDCDCQEGHAYWKNISHPQEEVCYPLYQQGPCPNRQILYLSNEETPKVICKANRCRKGEVDVVVRNGTLHLAQTRHRQGTCLVLKNQGPCPPNEVVDVHPQTMKLACLTNLRLRTLINAPVINCSPGSKRDALGRCRRSMF